MTAPALPLMSDDDFHRGGAGADGQGFGALATAQGNLPLVALDVRAQLTGLLARLTLTQTFANPFDERLEATYIFPLPDRGALTRLRMQVADRVIEGVLKERGEARQDYDQAIQDGHRAAIAEEERPGVFTLRMGNLGARERATVTLHLTVPLTFEDGEATFRFPLVVSPRYIPGRPLGDGDDVGSGIARDTDAVPDASRITPPVLLPGFPNPIRLRLEVEVDPAGLEVGPLRSSLHAVTIAALPGGRTHLRIQPGERVDRDFILRFPVAPSGVASGLVRAADAKGETLALTLVPPAGLSQAARPRDVVFVLDRSGSMSGWKMVAARRALGRMVDTLTARDRFTVLAFDNVVDPVAPLTGTALEPADDRRRFRVVEGLGSLNARGGTELYAPLHRAVELLATGAVDRDRILVLVTDGAVGNEDQILASIGPRLSGLRVFTVGVDTAVNEGFLRRLAALGGGSCALLESEDRLDEAMDQLHRRIATPVLEGLRIELEGATLEAGTMVPARLPALFVGTPLTVLGRLTGAAEGVEVRARVTATDALGQPWSTTLVARPVDSEAMGVTWARGALRTLEDRYLLRDGSDLDALEARIVALSLDHGVLCRFTAFVAVDRANVVDTRVAQHSVTQAVELPMGWVSAHPSGPPGRPRSGMPLAPPPPSAPAPASAPSLKRKLMAALQIGGSRGHHEAVEKAASGGPPAPVKAEEGGLQATRNEASRARLAWAPAFGAGLSELEAEEPLDEAEPALSVPVLSAYVQRARALASELVKTPELASLRATAMALATLLEDLESTVPDAPGLAALKELLRGLREALRRDPVDVAALVAQVRSALEAFAEGTSPQLPESPEGSPREPSGRRAFWR